MSLVDQLIARGYLKTPLIIEAFKAIDRADFIPEDMRHEAEVNAPLPIGYGQTISQPLTVAFMLELLQPESGNRVLDVGYGSGWTTALLAYVVSQKLNEKINGKVYAIERIPELARIGKENVAKYNYLERGVVEMICGDGTKGWYDFAACPELACPEPCRRIEGFDRIQAAASVPVRSFTAKDGAQRIPQAWKDQLKVGGRLVTPVGGSIWLLVKKSEKEFEEYEYPGFAFVPLIEG